MVSNRIYLVLSCQRIPLTIHEPGRARGSHFFDFQKKHDLNGILRILVLVNDVSTDTFWTKCVQNMTKSWPKGAQTMDTCPNCDQNVPKHWTTVQNVTKKLEHLSKMQPKSAWTLDTCPKCDQNLWTLVQNVTKKFGHLQEASADLQVTRKCPKFLLVTAQV